MPARYLLVGRDRKRSRLLWTVVGVTNEQLKDYAIYIYIGDETHETYGNTIPHNTESNFNQVLEAFDIYFKP